MFVGLSHVIIFIDVCSVGGDEQRDSIRELNLPLFMPEQALRMVVVAPGI